MSNPFDDDYKGAYGSSSGKLKSYTSSSGGGGGHGGTIEDEADYYEREIEKYMQESLDSTQRSRAHLENSEKIGANTMQDLMEQREKLEKTERNLDQIHHTTQVTQRNLNSLKSVFGGFFKNKFSRKPTEPPKTDIPQSKSSNGLSSQQGGGSSSGALSSSAWRKGSADVYSTSSSGPTLSDSSRQAIKGSRWEAMDNQIDENLDAMSSNLANLRMMGTALGKEVEDQNAMLDRIQKKADRNDVVVRSQDKQMQKLLGTEAKAAEKESAMSSLTPSSTSTVGLAMKAGSMFR